MYLLSLFFGSLVFKAPSLMNLFVRLLLFSLYFISCSTWFFPFLLYLSWFNVLAFSLLVFPLLSEAYLDTFILLLLWFLLLVYVSVYRLLFCSLNLAITCSVLVKHSEEIFLNLELLIDWFFSLFDSFYEEVIGLFLMLPTIRDWCTLEISASFYFGSTNSSYGSFWRG